MPTISMSQYLAASNGYQGWCPDCQDFTRDETEPDADGYECPCCEGNHVMGAENALMAAEFDISDEDIDK